MEGEAAEWAEVTEPPRTFAVDHGFELQMPKIRLARNRKREVS